MVLYTYTTGGFFMKDIYILLTKCDTLFSKAIYKITRAEYTHASISLDRELTKLYSFGRK